MCTGYRTYYISIVLRFKACSLIKQGVKCAIETVEVDPDYNA